ncbi:MAG: 1-deoxy-D-xylulose-5-phosphate synthase, partial [Muribaculaceae bacterium]|nr:1-deoxy-D-xylulose-5-phosphate synthase [Muribaculaceae bacterium]
LLQIARENDKVVGITAAMSSGTGMSIMQSELPARVFDVGISEGHAVTFAGGLAKDGMHPFVAIYSSFLQRAYDHMIHDVAIQHLPVTFCIDRAGVVGEDGVTHHGAFDLAYLRSIPGMSIASPSDAAMLRNLMFTSLTFNGPLALRYPRGKAIAATDEVMAAPMTWMEPGCGRQLARGSKVVFLSIGPIAAEVSKAVELLKDEGVDAAHYDMIWLYPLDTSIVDAVGRMNCPILTVEDGVTDGGLGSAVMERLNDMGYNGRQVTRIGMPSHTFVEHGSIAELYKICEMDASSIAKAALRAINSHSMPAVQ